MLKIRVGVHAPGQGAELVGQGVAHGVGKGGLLAPEDGFGQQALALEGAAQEVFANAVAVHFELRVYGHYVAHEVEVPEGHPRLQRVDGDAAVRAQHVIGVELAHPLLRLALEFRRRGGEVGVLVAEELVGDLAREQDADVGLLVYGLADEIHTYAGPDGGDVVAADGGDDLGQGRDGLTHGDYDLRVLAAEEVRGLAGVAEVDGVVPHAYGKGAQALSREPCRYAADEGGVQPAAEEKAYLRVGDQALFHGPDEPCAYASADLVLVPGDCRPGLAGVGVAVKAPAAPKAAGREGHDPRNEADKVLGLAGEEHLPARVPAVKEGAYAYGVARGNELARSPVVDDERKLRVEHLEHGLAVLPPEGQQHLAVGAAFEAVFRGEGGLYLFKAVDLSVADDIVPVQLERLHPARLQAHDGQTVEGEDAVAQAEHAAVVRAARLGPVEARGEGGHVGLRPAVTHYGAHGYPPQPTP